ncbi:MAG: SRPBCC family protein [Actinomycetes bacterium]
MAKYSTVIDTPADIATAFDYLARFSSTKDWDPGVSDASMITPEPVTVGSLFQVVASLAGRNVPLTYAVTSFDRPNSVTVRAENNSVISEDTITFEVVQTQDKTASGHLTTKSVTRVTYHAELSLKGAFVIFSPFLNLLLNHIGTKAAGGLQSALLELAGNPQP